MALGGDIIFKLVADFAEATTGLAEANKKLDEFGKHASKANESITGLIETIKKTAVGIAGALGVEKVLEFGKGIEETAAKVKATAETLQLSTDAFQALQAAASHSGLGFEESAQLIGKFNVAIGAAASGSKQQIDALNTLGVKILDANRQLRPQADILREVSDALLRMPEGAQKARVETELFGKTGQQVNVVLQEWRRSLGDLQSDYSRLIFPEEVLRKLDELKTRGEEARRALEVRIAPFWAEIKTETLEGINRLFEAIANSAKEAAQQTGTLFDRLRRVAEAQRQQAPLQYDEFGNIKDQFSPSMGGAPALKSEAEVASDILKRNLEDVQKQVADTTAELEKQQQQFSDQQRKIEELIRSQHGFTDEVIGAIAQQAYLGEAIDKNTAKLAALKGQMQDTAIAAGQAADALAKAAYGPAWSTDKPPGGAAQPVPTGGRGGGGRTDDQNVQAQIDRYNALAKSAQHAFQTIEDSAKQPLEDLRRNVTVQQQIDDIVGKLSAKYAEAHKERIEQLRQAVTAAETERAAVQRRLEDETRAQQLEEQFGTSGAAFARRSAEIKRALDTQRLSTEGAARAMKEMKEQTDEAAAAATKYGSAIGALAGGFMHAALAQSDAETQFKIGEAAFTGLTDAMGEAIDVLVGRSQKGFGQIAADFLLMIAKMEAAAAASAAIKLLIGAIGGAAGGAAGGFPGIGGTGTPGADWFSGSSGGGFLSSIFGGGRQGGGPVFPGLAYNVGESGPERFVPAIAGHIVPAGGHGNITVINNTPARVRTERHGDDVRFIIEATKQSLSRDVARGGNEFASSLERTYGMNRGGG